MTIDKKREWYLKNKERISVSNKENYKSNSLKYKKKVYEARYLKFGSSLKEKKEIWKSQSGKCPICDKKIPMFTSPFDHDHKINKVRGVLCDNCNKGLGHFRDDVNLLKKAISYLEHFKQN